MAQVLVRNLNENTVARLKQRAATRGVSLEAEIRDTLDRDANPDHAALLARLQAIRDRIGPQEGPGVVELIRQARDELDAKWR